MSLWIFLLTLEINLAIYINQINIMDKISNLTDTVEQVLLKDERCRDDDRLLTAIVWFNVIKDGKYNFSTMSAKDLLDLYIKGLMPNHDSITRARRKVQELNPELRGSKYESRQGYQKDVKKDLGYG
jgi:hypothetical protein